MGYVIVTRYSDITCTRPVCHTLEGKNAEVAKSFNNRKAVSIEVMFSDDRNREDTITTEGWVLKKPFLGLFGSAKWEMQL